MKEILNQLFDFAKIKGSICLATVSVLVMKYIHFHDPVKKLIMFLMFAVIIDIITGIVKNRIIKGKNFTSSDLIAWDIVVYKKRKIKVPKKFVVVAFWFLGLDLALMANEFLTEFGITGHYLAKGYIAFYFFYEFISVLENAGEIGVPGVKQIAKLIKGKMPEGIKDLVEEAKEEEKKNDN